MPEVYSAKRSPSDGDNKKIASGTKRKRTPQDYSDVLQEKTHNHPLASYMVCPQRFGVEIQDPEERVLLLVRRHPITNLKWILVALLMALAPVVFLSSPVLSFFPERYQFLSIVLWYLLTTAVVVEGFFSWFFDMFVITDERVIDIDFRNLIYKNITATKIDQIEDVTYSVSGSLPSLFNFGNVLVQTAGAVVKLTPQDTSAAIEIRATPRPARVAKLLNELILEEEREEIEGRVR